MTEQFNLFDDRPPSGHLRVIHDLALTFKDANDRLLTGDITHPRFILAKLRTYCESARRDLRTAGAINPWIDCFDAGGGMVAFTYQYTHNDTKELCKGTLKPFTYRL
jgi:hypothetical protein